jgi:hypothetical protein
MHTVGLAWTALDVLLAGSLALVLGWIVVRLAAVGRKQSALIWCGFFAFAVTFVALRAYIRSVDWG